MSTLDSPFLVYGYENPDYFCDREAETDHLIQAVTNGNNVTLTSPRRIGKTGLIKNCFYHLKQTHPDIACFYMDIFATQSLSDFVEVFGQTVIGQLDTPQQRAEGFIHHFFHSCEITFSVDPLTMLPQVGLRFVPQECKRTLDEIFAYLAQSGRKCIIAIDEFQQIVNYPETNVEALLRTYVQQSQQLHFIFSGSKLHMMDAMFDSPKRPFYKSTEKIPLDVIAPETYYAFANKWLLTKQIQLSRELFDKVYHLVDGVTWYIQAIMNRLYRYSPCVLTEPDILNTIHSIIQSEEENFKRQYQILTNNQANLLSAIAKEQIVKEPLAGTFIHTYHLKSTSSVQRAFQFLNDEEYVYQTKNGYIVYDRFLALWLRSKLR